MIKIFESTATDFKSNGIKTIKPIKAIETKKQSLNGWELDVVVSLEHKDLIQQDMIVTAKVKGSINPQAFRIANPTYTKKTIEFKAHHVIFDSEYLLIEDTRPTKVNAATALQDLNRNTVDKSPFTFTSNVGGSNTAYILNKSLLEAMDTVQQRWGGKYVIDNFNVSLQLNPGYDNGEVISYGKNLEDIKVFEDWSGVVTKLKPRGFDGITLPEVFILGDVEYDKPYTKTIKFETEIEEEDRTEELLITELRDLATKYVTDNQYPKVSYEVKSDINQNLDIYDTVTVKHPIVTLTTEVQEYEYDINTKRVKKLVFGNYDRDVKKRFDQIKDDIQKNKEQMSDFEAIVFEQTDLINSMNKYGHVYIDDNQIMILDKLPKENAKNVWRWNMGGLGFSKNGIEGPFETAWTIDGTFNANFIGAYAIKANQLASDVGSSLDLSSNVAITNIVENMNSNNSIINMNGEFGFEFWSGNSDYLYLDEKDTYIDEFLTYGIGFRIVEVKGAKSETGLEFYNSGWHLSAAGKIIQGLDYSFKAKVKGNRNIKITVKEYRALTLTPINTVFNFTNYTDEIEFTLTPKTDTNFIRLEFDLAVDINNRVTMYDMMFNDGIPRDYVKSVHDVLTYSKSMRLQFEDEIKDIVSDIEFIDGKVVEYDTKFVQTAKDIALGSEKTEEVRVQSEINKGNITDNKNLIGSVDTVVKKNTGDILLNSNAIAATVLELIEVDGKVISAQGQINVLKDGVSLSGEKIDEINGIIKSTLLDLSADEGVVITSTAKKGLTIKNSSGEVMVSLGTDGNIISKGGVFTDVTVTGNLVAGNLGEWTFSKDKIESHTGGMVLSAYGSLKLGSTSFRGNSYLGTQVEGSLGFWASEDINMPASFTPALKIGNFGTKPGHPDIGIVYTFLDRHGNEDMRHAIIADYYGIHIMDQYSWDTYENKQINSLIMNDELDSVVGDFSNLILTENSDVDISQLLVSDLYRVEVSQEGYLKIVERNDDHEPSFRSSK